jgi:hypothetical protein
MKPLQIEVTTQKLFSQTVVFQHSSNFCRWVMQVYVVRKWQHTCLRVCGKNLNIISMCAVSPVVDTLNVSNCQGKKLFQFSSGCEQFH